MALTTHAKVIKISCCSSEILGNKITLILRLTQNLEMMTQLKGTKRREIESATLKSLLCLKSYELRSSLSALKFQVAFLFVALAS